jgi:uncharacterized protein YukE
MEMTVKDIGKESEARRNDILADIRSAHEALVAKVQDANIAIREANEALEAYNETVEEANRFAADVGAEIAEYTADKSEKWQEGDKGQAYQEWQTEWESFYAETVDPFDELTEPDDAASDVLENAPSEPNV